MSPVPPRSWLLAVTLCGVALLAAGCLGISDQATTDREDRSQDEPSSGEDPFDVTDAFPTRDPQPRYSYERDTRQGNATGVDVGLIHGVGDPQETFEVGRDTVRFDVLVLADEDLHVAVYPPDCEPDVAVEPPECAHSGETEEGMVYWSLPDPPTGTWSVDLWMTEPSFESADWTVYTGALILEG